MLLRAKSLSVAVMAVVSLVVCPGSASAIGYFNLPGNCCQWNGYGCGPGYHAPMALGPISLHGLSAHGVERWPFPPAPPCALYDGCGPHGCSIGEPTMLESGPLPDRDTLPAPLPLPEANPAAGRVPFWHSRDSW